VAKIPPIEIGIQVVRPYDTLILGIPDPRLTDQIVGEIKEYIRERMPLVTVLIVPAVTMAVYRPD
jgi:hypothetical protein